MFSQNVVYFRMVIYILFSFLQNEGQTPLHMAAIMGDEQFIKFLHMVGAKPNLQDKQERTPLHLATENGHMKTVDFLTEKFRASVHERTKVSLFSIVIIYLILIDLHFV